MTNHVTIWLKRLTHPLGIGLYGVLVILSYMCIDKPLALLMHSYDLRAHYPLLSWVTQLGVAWPYLLILPLIALYYRTIHRVKQTELRLWFLWGSLLLADQLCFGLKMLLGRARPELLFDQHIFGFYGFSTQHLYHSCPSGHTTVATVAALGLSLLWPYYRWVFVGLAFAVVATRIVLTHHYLSDVIFSAYLVVLEYRLLFYIVQRQCPWYWRKLGVV